MLAYLYSWIYPEVPVVPIAPLAPLAPELPVPVSVPVPVVPIVPIVPVVPLVPVNPVKMLNVQLDDILSVKLKKTDVNPKPQYYRIRHPVLRELMIKK